MNRKVFIIILVILTIGISGIYFIYDQTFGQFWIAEKTLIESVDNSPRTFKLTIDNEAKFPHSMDLRIKGKLNGKAIIGYGWSDTTIYQSDTVENGFEKLFGGDWYSDSCFVFYKPITATSGEIEIQCEIYSSKK